MVIAVLQLARHRLREGAPAGGEVDRVAAAARLLANVRPAAVQGVCLHHRAAPAAVGIVVHLHLLVGRVVADLVGFDRDVPALLRAPEDADIHHRIDRGGEKR